MKHLKRYNELKEWQSTNFDSINIEDVKDILLELEDIGFAIRYKYDTLDKISIECKTQKDEIIWGDVKDCILRLKKYLGDSYSYSRIYSDRYRQERKIITPYSENMDENTSVYEIQMTWCKVKYN